MQPRCVDLVRRTWIAEFLDQDLHFFFAGNILAGDRAALAARFLAQRRPSWSVDAISFRPATEPEGELLRGICCNSARRAKKQDRAERKFSHIPGPSFLSVIRHH